MRAPCPRKTQHRELITGGDEIRFVASLQGFWFILVPLGFVGWLASLEPQAFSIQKYICTFSIFQFALIPTIIYNVWTVAIVHKGNI